MDEAWNSWDLLPPPAATVKTICQVKDLKEINSILFDATSTLKRLDFLHKEAAVLSRFLYRFKKIFRHDKGVHNMSQIKQCLLRYLKLDLQKTLIDFKQSLPLIKKQTIGSGEFYLPTQQRFKWVLLRLQTFSKLFLRIIDLTKASGTYLIGKLSRRWSTSYMMFMLGLAGRIFVTSKFLISKAIEWYNSLRQYLSIFTETVDYLEGHDFPANLKMWLDYDDSKPTGKKASIDDIFDYIDLEGNEDVIVIGDESDEEEKRELLEWENIIMDKVKDLKVEEERREKEEENSSLKRKRSDFQEDLGVPINVSSKKKKGKNKKKKNVPEEP